VECELYITGRPAVCCGVQCCPFVVSFSRFHEPDTQDLLRTSSRGCHEDATRKLLPWNFTFKVRRPVRRAKSRVILEPLVRATISRLQDRAK